VIVAQLNVARMRYPLDSAELADFVAGLTEIHAIAEASPGYVWREDATRLRPLGPEILFNLSTWRTVEDLRAFTYYSRHVEFMRRRREWFDLEGLSAFLVLWWVPDGHRPTLAEGKRRLDRLAAHGPSPLAFTLKTCFPAPVCSVSAGE